jgi:hypothetical protein
MNGFTIQRAWVYSCLPSSRVLSIPKVRSTDFGRLGLKLFNRALSTFLNSEWTQISRSLRRLAAPLSIRIGYEALAWGRGVNEYPVAWEAVKREDRENVGLVVDSFHILVKGTSLEYLATFQSRRSSSFSSRTTCGRLMTSFRLPGVVGSFPGKGFTAAPSPTSFGAWIKRVIAAITPSMSSTTTISNVRCPSLRHAPANLRTGWASKCRACVRVIDNERNKKH